MLLKQHAPTWLMQLPAMLSAMDRDAVVRRALGATRERMLRELVEALEALSRDEPLVLLLEDLHWSELVDHRLAERGSPVGPTRRNCSVLGCIPPCRRGCSWCAPTGAGEAGARAARPLHRHRAGLPDGRRSRRVSRAAVPRSRVPPGAGRRPSPEHGRQPALRRGHHRLPDRRGARARGPHGRWELSSPPEDLALGTPETLAADRRATPRRAPGRGRAGAARGGRAWQGPKFSAAVAAAGGFARMTLNGSARGWRGRRQFLRATGSWQAAGWDSRGAVRVHPRAVPKRAGMRGCLSGIGVGLAPAAPANLLERAGREPVPPRLPGILADAFRARPGQRAGRAVSEAGGRARLAQAWLFGRPSSIVTRAYRPC